MRVIELDRTEHQILVHVTLRGADLLNRGLWEAVSQSLLRELMEGNIYCNMLSHVVAEITSQVHTPVYPCNWMRGSTTNIPKNAVTQLPLNGQHDTASCHIQSWPPSLLWMVTQCLSRILARQTSKRPLSGEAPCTWQHIRPPTPHPLYIYTLKSCIFWSLEVSLKEGF